MDDSVAAILLQENLELREKIIHLERSLGMDFLPPVEWRLTPSEARLFGALLKRDVLTKEALMATLYYNLNKDEAEIKIVDVFVCKIRKKLAPFGIKIETRRGVGYELTSESKAIVRAHMETQDA